MKQIRALEVLLRQHGLLAAPADRDAAVTGICNDSRQARPGDLFICKGYGFKPEYLEMARAGGRVRPDGDRLSRGGYPLRPGCRMCARRRAWRPAGSTTSPPTA